MGLDVDPALYDENVLDVLIFGLVNITQNASVLCDIDQTKNPSFFSLRRNFPFRIAPQPSFRTSP
jgi:hypothetical protein